MNFILINLKKLKGDNTLINNYIKNEFKNYQIKIQKNFSI